MKKIKTKSKLALKRETLRQLGAEQLENVAGATALLCGGNTTKCLNVSNGCPQSRLIASGCNDWACQPGSILCQSTLPLVC